MTRRLATILNARYGRRHAATPRAVGLSFDTTLPDAAGGSHYLSPIESTDFIDLHAVTDVRLLNGKKVWVLIADGAITVDGPCIF